MHCWQTYLVDKAVIKSYGANDEQTHTSTLRGEGDNVNRFHRISCVAHDFLHRVFSPIRPQHRRVADHASGVDDRCVARGYIHGYFHSNRR